MHPTLQPPNEPPRIEAPTRRGPRRARSQRPALDEAAFLDALRQERRRSERSGKPFLLMLGSLRRTPDGMVADGIINKLFTALCDSVRETDTIGWYEQEQVLGVILTELGDAGRDAILSSLRLRVSDATDICRLKPFAVTFTFHFFPDESSPDVHVMDFNLYPELFRERWSRKIARGIKRLIDVVVSSFVLACLSVALLTIALLIKLTSKGPVLFRQIRVGQHGRTFCFLKFRSMYQNNDATLHREYVSRFIAGRAELHAVNGTRGVYKLTNDPRVTPFGRILRKTSLDELPQLLNVIKGEMSLIGPRPPVPYEFQHYSLWHRRRVLEIKPGITGLWQVSGRSRTSFDDMVRLDLQYAREWSLWLDFNILWQTPKAVFSGNGAH